jgi:hypothetical protein
LYQGEDFIFFFPSFSYFYYPDYYDTLYVRKKENSIWKDRVEGLRRHPSIHPGGEMMVEGGGGVMITSPFFSLSLFFIISPVGISWFPPPYFPSILRRSIFDVEL